MKRITILILLIFIGAAGVLFAVPDFDKMLEEIDTMGTFEGKDFSAVYTMVSEKPGEDVSVTKLRMFRRDDKEQFVMLILEPNAQRGQGYLRLDENVWFYDPESRKFEKSTLKENIQDSDTRNSDMDGSTLAEDYDVVDYSEGKLGSFDVWVLDLKANNRDVSYDKLKIWVRKDSTIVLKQEEYSVNGRLMRSTYLPKYISVDGKLIPSKILMVDELNVGEKTQLSIKDATVANIPDYVFTKAYIERVSN